jgi:hypothetical protein
MPDSGRSASSALPLPCKAARLASMSWTACLASDTVTESTANPGCQDPSLKGSHCQSLSPPFLLLALFCFFAPCSPSLNQKIAADLFSCKRFPQTHCIGYLSMMPMTVPLTWPQP